MARAPKLERLHLAKTMHQLIRKNVFVAWCLLTIVFLRDVSQFYSALWDENATTSPLFYRGRGIFPGAFVIAIGLLAFVRFAFIGNQRDAKLAAFVIGAWVLVSEIILPLLIADVYGRTNSATSLLFCSYVSASFFLYAFGYRGHEPRHGTVWAGWVNALFDRLRDFGFGKTVLICAALYGLFTLSRISIEDHRCKVHCESIGAAKYFFEPAFCGRFHCTQMACTCTTQEEIDQSNAEYESMMKWLREERAKRGESP